MDITRTIRDEAALSDDERVNAFRSLAQDIEAFRQDVQRAGGRIPKRSALDISLETTTRVAPYFIHFSSHQEELWLGDSGSTTTDGARFVDRLGFEDTGEGWRRLTREGWARTKPSLTQPR